ncbi:uncharacterized protein PHALS_15343 [Plasmopara halstedii]|uniref:Uncharacterized protein n=1 Tax=Plasmopara halstedii TaxID=4781 RepID=A0A0P1AE30_PLAHL|nr:uncharacterized protein PHALS_15343 [Plasmopara halstedii]CEG38886.1 hypothetical protein PHALS_15343 [Plasmopara halstedii]|eukprot:XP_024575255.1 hypothetical protein PHALS_15343 [Plasmopara halstedii]
MSTDHPNFEVEVERDLRLLQLRVQHNKNQRVLTQTSITNLLMVLHATLSSERSAYSLQFFSSDISGSNKMDENNSLDKDYQATVYCKDRSFILI